jgi:hypothetical protein
MAIGCNEMVRIETWKTLIETIGRRGYMELKTGRGKEIKTSTMKYSKKLILLTH